MIRNDFVVSFNCLGIDCDKFLRVFCDSIEYLFFWNGLKKMGVIFDFLMFMKCGVIYLVVD